eukprot:842593-Alexandrium_andersonii.AAC.1
MLAVQHRAAPKPLQGLAELEGSGRPQRDDLRVLWHKLSEPDPTGLRAGCRAQLCQRRRRACREGSRAGITGALCARL